MCVRVVYNFFVLDYFMHLHCYILLFRLLTLSAFDYSYIFCCVLLSCFHHIRASQILCDAEATHNIWLIITARTIRERRNVKCI